MSASDVSPQHWRHNETQSHTKTAAMPKAVYLDLQPKLEGRAVDLGAGVGLTCLVLMRSTRCVTCNQRKEPVG